MKAELITLLETICPSNVYLQGTIDEDVQYPDEFITFWTNSADNDEFYDNEEHDFIWNFGVFYYSNDPEKVSTVPAQIRTALKEAGFIPQGKGNDIVSDVKTHTGWAMEFLYKELNTNETKGE